jgi:hypothetical protein
MSEMSLLGEKINMLKNIDPQLDASEMSAIFS